jgi:hypothetical protein
MEIWKKVKKKAEEERKRREKKEEERMKKEEEEEEKERRKKRRKNSIWRGIEGEGPRERRRAAELIMEREVAEMAVGEVGEGDTDQDGVGGRARSKRTGQEKQIGKEEWRGG